MRISAGIAISLLLLVPVLGCGSDTATPTPDGDDPLDGIGAIAFIQRAPREADVGDIFQYQSYIPGARLVSLSPPSADGKLTVLCCDEAGPEYANIDISWFDVSFDAREIVFSAKLSEDQRYSLFVLSLDSGKVEQLPTDPNRDYVYPIFLPGNKIFFVSNAVVEDGAPQFEDEYERRETTQVGTISRDGSGLTLGARNLSHRVYPTLMADGRVLYTQWDHLGEKNSGDLVFSNPDMTTVREAFGKEDTGVTNSYLKAVEVAPGRVVAIGTARDRTLQSGTILDIRLGKQCADDPGRWDCAMSEANASYRILTPQVPLDREPSSETVGRYYDVYPLDASDAPKLLVSWADGPVESSTLAAAGLSADFGIFLYDAKSHQRRPLWNDTEYWDVMPRPLVARDAPPVIPPAGKDAMAGDVTLIGAMNVYRSSLQEFAPGSIYGVRVIEGFSAEEGIPEDFGLSEHEGAAVLGIADVQDDGSWAALVPANTPVHMQPIDKFGMALLSEPVWISGNAGESRFCGGCHEDRAAATVIQPGITDAIAVGPNDLMSQVARFDRKSTTYTIEDTVGVPWDLALQPIFDAKCAGCHDGTPGPANPSYTITDPETGASQTITFDLRGTEISYGSGDEIMSGYSASHLSLLGPNMSDLQEAGLVIEGDPPIYVEPGNARESVLIQKINPPVLFPAPDTSQRAFDGPVHPADVGGEELTPQEYYLLILMADAGGQFYSRENAPGQN
ncbi:MAG TPA: hypothetical protein VFG83_12695 [Kofleriaceae bacterium]|nr:hypothetical protein [Kofleriaceae bacterium]